MDKIQELQAPLKIDDIELRVGSNSAKSFTLLLYKTARTDINRLNEVFGSKWKNRHFYDDKKYLCCEISVYDDEIKEWVTRVDVGTESNTEKEKGSYSDSFKRAGTRFGIGVELYQAPTIRIMWDMDANKKPVNFFSSNLSIDEYSFEDNKMNVKISYKGKGVIFDSSKSFKKTQPDKLKKEKKVIDSEFKSTISEFIKSCNTEGDVQKVYDATTAKYEFSPNQEDTLWNLFQLRIDEINISKEEPDELPHS